MGEDAPDVLRSVLELLGERLLSSGLVELGEVEVDEVGPLEVLLGLGEGRVAGGRKRAAKGEGSACVRGRAPAVDDAKESGTHGCSLVAYICSMGWRAAVMMAACGVRGKGRLLMGR